MELSTPAAGPAQARTEARAPAATSRSEPVPQQVMGWAQRPGATALLMQARTKLEAGRDGDRVRLPLRPEHRDDVGRMLGVTWELSGAAATLRLLREALTRAGTDLVTVLTAIGGPLRDRPAERTTAQDRAETFRAAAVAVLVDAGVPAPVAELAVRRRRWFGPDPQTAAEVAEQVAAAWTVLPAPPRSPPAGTGTADDEGPAGGHGTVRGLAELAWQELGDPHALDGDRPAGRALVRVAATTFAYFDDDEGGLERAATVGAEALRAQRWRAVWDRLGVACDRVSSTVLLLNVTLKGSSPALERVTGTAGEPVWVTVRMTEPGCEPADAAPAGAVVRVCENPSVAEAAADELGAACPPLVCLYGRPSSAAWAVLSALLEAGYQLLISTDRDAAGRQIAADVARLGATLANGAGTGSVAEWLPGVDGLYEEERLAAMLRDLREHACTTPV